MTEDQRQVFDALVDEAMENLPEPLRELVDEVPVIVLDRPTRAMLRDLGLSPADGDEICGLHTGRGITERSVEHSGELPEHIHIFRIGIVNTAGGWHAPEAQDRVYEEIMITILHEIGHHFGLDEDDLEQLGYD